MGRFTRPDPYDGSYDPSNPQSMNRRNYVMNMPMLFTDTSGLDFQDCRTYDYSTSARKSSVTGYRTWSISSCIAAGAARASSMSVGCDSSAGRSPLLFCSSKNSVAWLEHGYDAKKSGLEGQKSGDGSDEMLANSRSMVIDEVDASAKIPTHRETRLPS
jgi:hypothetical protein